MTNLELEKIQRALYKQEQQKKAENKIKYPFIYDNNSNKNIKNYFEFDKITSNPPSPSTSYLSDKEIKIKEENQINYDINSFIDNENIPDLYTPLGKISGDNYNLIKKDNLYLDCLNQEEEDINNNNEKRIIAKKRLRYFDLYFDLDTPEITIKKLPYSKNKKFKRKSYFNTTSKSNFIFQQFCYICLSKDHLYKKECPKYKRCYKCLKYGHWGKDCEEVIKDKCENCHISAHKKEDCLKFRDEIKNEDLFLVIKKNGLKCAFCEQSSHLICPFSLREKYILKYEKNNNIKQNNENVKDYSKILFCPFCAGNHLKKECPEINKNNINNNSNLSEKNYLSNLSSNFSSSKDQSFDSLDINNSFNKSSFNEDNEIKSDKNDIDTNINNYENKKEETNYNEKNDIINIKFTQRNNFKNEKDIIKKEKEKLFYNKPNNNNYYRNKQYGKNQYQNNQNHNSKKPGSLFEHYLAYKNRNTSS